MESAPAGVLRVYPPHGPCHHHRMEPTDEQVREAIVHLLRDRAPQATICPSEAARALAPQAWRTLMPQVRAVAVALAKDGVLDILQRGRTIAPGTPFRGPIRLAHPASRPGAPDNLKDHP